MPFPRGLEEDGPEYQNALSSGLEDKGRLWPEMPFPSGREEDVPEYRNALSSGREDKGRLWPGSPFYNQEIRISSSLQEVGTTCSFSDARNIMKIPLSSGREEDGP
ncbi:hypothetical protein CHS0354_026675 [Potamilus streckersoni]|uniref:Uncharacterized protein n=1 Tax=Potamilus streckersoni TaxID=2493646 RepID=A0AAE0S8I4_9BIVA|nr:hypothetical protein CHS0354_026675 [Potamilus streckersoni]